MSASDSDYSTGLKIVVAMLVGAAILGGAIWYADVPGGDLTQWVAIGAGVVGAALGFVAASYFMYGR